MHSNVPLLKAILLLLQLPHCRAQLLQPEQRRVGRAAWLKQRVLPDELSPQADQPVQLC